MAADTVERLGIVVSPNNRTSPEYKWLMDSIDELSSRLGVELHVYQGDAHPDPALGLLWYSGKEVNERGDDPKNVNYLRVLIEDFSSSAPRNTLALLRMGPSEGDSNAALTTFANLGSKLGFRGKGRQVVVYRDRVVFLARIHEFIYQFLVSRGDREPRQSKGVFKLEDWDVTGTYMKSHVRISEESITVGGVSDHVASVDTLGFAPHVRAVATFLRNDRTTPPFAMSVEGEWGVGKSSFMRQLQEELKGPQNVVAFGEWKSQRNLPKSWKKPITIWFNPWRHDRDESLWAAFALACLHGIPEEMGIWERQMAFGRMYKSRLKGKGWQVVKGLGKYLIAAAGIALLFTYGSEVAGLLEAGKYEQLLTQVFGGTAYLGVLLTLWRAGKVLSPIIKEPIASDLVKHMQAPDYSERITFLGSFHDEFHQIVTSLAGGRRVYVFIDDLDRCEVPRAAELLQAINLLTAGDAPLYFIIGMDREKVAAGVAAKHKPILDQLPEVNGLDFGYNFIQKFIQLPFRVPTPTGDQLEDMLDAIVGDGPVCSVAALKPVSGEGNQESDEGATEGSTKQGTGGDQSIPAPILRQRLVQINSFDQDSERIKNLIKLVAPFLGYNPRRVKQFAGLFRLQYYLAVETGLCDRDPSDESYKPLSIEQVGKFTALIYLWPRIVEELEQNPAQLSRWERYAIEPEYVPEDEIKIISPQLIDFMKVGLPSETEEHQVQDGLSEMYLGGADVERLLRIATPIAWELARDDDQTLGSTASNGRSGLDRPTVKNSSGINSSALNERPLG